MKYIKTGMLAFEVTRRCNQNCIHCLKGNSQNIDMSKQVIDHLFRNEDYKIVEISHIAITGGEPTLVPDLIAYLIDTIIELNISITSHVNYLTNGLIYSDKIVASISKLMNYLKQKEKCKNVQLVFELSNDQFHKRPKKDILAKYAQLPFINKSLLQPGEMPSERIMNEGNARMNRIGGNKTYRDFMKEIYIITSDNEIEINNEILIASNGNIIPVGCASFIEEDKIALGNICETSLLTILEKTVNKKTN